MALSLMCCRVAESAELDCETMAFKLNPGDFYEFKLEVQSKTIRLELGDDFCSEPAKKWFGRQLILPRPGRREMPLPEQQKSSDAPLPPSASENTPMPSQAPRARPLPDLGLAPDIGGASPLPSQREFVKPGSAKGEANATDTSTDPTTETKTDVNTHVRTDAATEAGLSSPDGRVGDTKGLQEEEAPDGVAAPPPPEKDVLIKRCDRELSSFWSPGPLGIDGRNYWLAGVFTIDINNDGRVDDVGFKLKAKGRIGNVINYFPSSKGRLSGKTIDSLKLDDHKEVHRLCPDSLTFERPGAAEDLKKRKATDVKALRKDDKKKDEPKPEEEPAAQEEKKKGINPIIFIAGGLALVLFLAGSIGLAFAIRNMSNSKEDDEYEEIEEDDD